MQPRGDPPPPQSETPPLRTPSMGQRWLEDGVCGVAACPVMIGVEQGTAGILEACHEGWPGQVGGAPVRRELPPGWERVSLDAVCLEDRRGIDGASGEAAGLPYLGLENVESRSGKIAMEKDSNSRGISTCFRFGPEHILYGKLRPYLNKVALPNFQGRCTTELIPLLPKRNIHREFLALWLRRPETVDWVMREKTGSRMPRANMKRLMQLEVLLPPLSEQNRIVEILENEMVAVERARGASLDRVEAARALGAAFLREVFEFGTGELPSGWEWRALGNLCEVKRGKPITRKGITPGDIPVIAGGQQPAYYHNQANRMGEIITVSGSGAYAGFVKFFDRPIFASDCSTLQVKDGKVQMMYIYMAMKWRQQDIYDLRLGAAQPHVYPKDVSKIEIPLPPLDEQRQIVAALSAKMAVAEQASAATEAELEAIEALPGALLRRAFSGEV